MKKIRVFTAGSAIATGLVVCWLIAGTAARAQQAPAPHSHAQGAATTVTTLRTGLGNYHFAITTRSPQAQRFFDQGLTLVYGFNHGGAMRMFRKAAELDPAAAMPLWGLALALGPHINNPDVDPDSEKLAAETIKDAEGLAAKKGTARERAYITALSARYSAEPNPDLRKLDMAYKDAMSRLAKQYPKDPDAQTLYAESLMDLRPWALWSHEGEPSDVTPEVLALLEGVLKTMPNHPGANHYYIHAVEASPHPEKALVAARRLDTLVPGAGHLVHMPAHIYMRTGDFDKAAASNAAAAAIDERFIKQTGVKTGLYPVMYYNHNVHFESAASCMAGRYAEAKRTADKLVSNVSPYVADMPMLEGFIPQTIFVLLRFNKWDEILAMPEPQAQFHVTNVIWRYARTVAYAEKGDVTNAAAERQKFADAASQIPRDTPFGVLNTAGPVLDVATDVADARIAMAKGDKSGAIERWKAAVVAQDALRYDEPAVWYYPVRESLGAALLQNGQAAEAEQVFRDDLNSSRNPGNGRSLFGLWRSLDAQGKKADAAKVKQQFDVAWKGADVQLKVEDL